MYNVYWGTFIDKANELLEVIRIKRDDEAQGKPLVLLGHSLSTLLIEQVLANAHRNPKCTKLRGVVEAFLAKSTSSIFARMKAG